jgi:GNAT superfamily N-acetyltransferase
VIEVRPRIDPDVPVLCEVLAAQAEASGYPIRWPWSGPVEEFVVRRGEEAAWTAVVDERPVGHVSVTRVAEEGDGIAEGWMAATGAPTGRLACISVLFVDHTVRQGGIGSALLDAATAWILERDRIPVLDVVAQHPGIVELHRRRGWRQVGTADPPWLPEARGLVLMVLDAP